MTDNTRAQIAERTGVPAHVLRGDTPEELQAHADQLLALGYPGLTPEEIVNRATGNTTDVDDIITQALGH